MPHPIFGQPEHSLEVVIAKLHLPAVRNDYVTTLEVTGESSTKRSSLWTYRETWDHTEQRGVLEPTDALHWCVLAGAQDRPNSQERFLRSITPGGWEDVKLPL